MSDRKLPIKKTKPLCRSVCPPSLLFSFFSSMYSETTEGAVGRSFKREIATGVFDGESTDRAVPSHSGRRPREGSEGLRPRGQHQLAPGSMDGARPAALGAEGERDVRCILCLLVGVMSTISVGVRSRCRHSSPVVAAGAAAVADAGAAAAVVAKSCGPHPVECRIGGAVERRRRRLPVRVRV